jgi:hypothetical protein
VTLKKFYRENGRIRQIEVGAGQAVVVQ